MPILGFVSQVRLGVPVVETPNPLRIRLIDLASRYQKGEISVIDMSAITTFAWDRLYLFGNYTKAETLDTVVGKSWRDKCRREGMVLSSADSYTLLIFTSNDMVIYCLSHPHDIYPFYFPPKGYYSELGFSPQEALFVVNKHGYMILKDTK
jgi:hypothetical protein